AFPYRELHKRLLAQAPEGNFNLGRRCQQAIQGWKQYVVPYTPPVDSLVTRGPPPDTIANIVTTLLLQTTEDTSITHPSVSPQIKPLMDIWPTVWIWIQFLHARVLKARKDLLNEEDMVNERSRYEAVVNGLLFFLGYNLEINDSLNELTMLVRHTDGVFKMMATSWIEESKDKQAKLGYSAGGMHHPSVRHSWPDIEKFMIAGCGGNKNQVANYAFLRITHSLHRPRHRRASLDADTYLHLAQDMAYVRTIMDLPSSTLYEASRARPGCMAFCMDTMLCLMKPRHLPIQYDLFSTAMVIVGLYCSSIQPYAGIRELIESRFFDVLARNPLKSTSLESHDKVALNRFNLTAAQVIGLIGSHSYGNPDCRKPSGTTLEK
ncbi:hypothetical protein HWV62_41274, partial [Athelia sp. TMB]